MWGMWLAYIPVVAFVSLLQIPQLTWTFGLAWLALVAISSGFVVLSKCPRCNSLFHTTMLWGNCWARKCIHCGLPLGR
jgi:hypothetical protein